MDFSYFWITVSVMRRVLMVTGVTLILRSVRYVWITVSNVPAKLIVKSVRMGSISQVKLVSMKRLLSMEFCLICQDSPVISHK